MDKDITEHYKKLYQFALAALEKIPLDTHTSAKSQPDGPTDVRNRNPRATSSEIKEQKTFLVTYMGGNPRRLHSETISASSEEEVKQKVRGRYPRATFKEIKIKEE